MNPMPAAHRENVAERTVRHLGMMAELAALNWSLTGCDTTFIVKVGRQPRTALRRSAAQSPTRHVPPVD